ncbi:site-determining protein [Campylobacterota bacterium]|nr:site-determining protein [Campylobacterota bacterium]
MKHQAHKLEELFNKKEPRTTQTRVIAITSGKGGVGKTTISANIGYLLAKRGLNVGLFDADIGLANLDVMLGVKANKTILNLLRGECSIEEIVLPIGDSSLFLIPGESGGEILRFSDQFMMDRFYDEIKKLDFLDYLIIDTGAGIGETVQMFLNAADDVIVVTVPDPAAITDAYAMIKILSAKKKRVSMLLNQAQSDKEGEKVYEKVRKIALSNMPDLELALAGIVHRDDEVSRSVRSRYLFSKEISSGKTVAKMEEIADRITQVEQNMLQGEQESGFGRFFKRLLNQF